MTDALAERLLTKIMKWESETLANERFQIQMFAEIKYDNYQKYTQGMKYVESLALWLYNFDESDRTILYNFIKNELIYISELQMRNLVEMAYQFYIKPNMLKKVKTICLSSEIADFEKRKEIHEKLIKKSLFLGLSDGSHIDLFRRANPHLSNEQINVYYDISSGRIGDMLKNMPKLKEINNGISCIYLLDDFSGSGISFIRKEGTEWKGKIVKFIERLEEYKIDVTNIDIMLLLYVSTQDSIDHISTQLKAFKEEKLIEAEYSVSAIQYIEKPNYDHKIINLFEKYYDRFEMHKIEDIHYKKGNYGFPYLGFNEGGLPLVMFHNTPNNALPIIWFEKNDYSGLFPRVTRHKEVQ